MRKASSTVGAFNAKPSMTSRRQALKYSVSTTSTTASGVVPIKGATKYPAQPEIYFTREAWVKQCHLVHKSPMEVGWFALVDHDEANNVFTITELVIPKQEVTAAETDIGKEDLADAAMELIEQGKDTGKMYAWFHSHVNMGVSPSAQDEYQVEDFLEDLADQPEVPAFIRGIQNKAGDLKLDVYYIQHGIAYQNVEFYVIHDDDPQWKVDIESEIKTKVSARTYTTPFGAVGGQRHNTGKSQSGNGTANQNPNSSGYGWSGYNSGYGGYSGQQQGFDSYYDSYDDVDIYEAVEVGTAVDDSPNAPTPVSVTYEDYADLDVVYQSPQNIEILMDTDGKLLLCDNHGDVYDYAEYCEAFGQLDGAQAVL